MGSKGLKQCRPSGACHQTGVSRGVSIDDSKFSICNLLPACTHGEIRDDRDNMWNSMMGKNWNQPKKEKKVIYETRN